MDRGIARSPLNRRRLLQGTAGLGLAAAMPGRIGLRRAAAQANVNVVYKTHEHPPGVAVNKELIAAFQQANPGITIDYEAIPYPNFEQGLFTSFAGGDGWDLFWAGDWLLPQFFESDILAPLDPAAYGVASTDEFIGLYDPGALDAYVKDGNVYTGGISEYNTFSLVYNPDHFTEAGIPLLSETEPITWEELFEHAQKLSKVGADGKRERNAIVWAFTANVWAPLIAEPMVRQLGGELVDPASGEVLFTSPEVVKTMSYIGSLGTSGAVDPAFLGADLNDDFAKGRTSMAIAGAWAIPAIRSINPDAKIAIAPLPVFEGGTRTTTLYSWGWHVGSQSDAATQAAAWKFVGSIAAQGKKWWDEAGFIQPRNKGQEGVEDLAAYRNESEPLLKVFNDDFTYGKYMFRSTRFYEIATALMRVQSLVFEGEDAEQALKDAQDELDV
jgi:ABC-type glycerol-3-phosphate transport system substrate-binding protein